MPTALSLALSTLSDSAAPPTLSTILPHYIRFAGYPPTALPKQSGAPLSAAAQIMSPIAVAALRAFEHALDKHPASSSLVRDLRRAYWRLRLGADIVPCRCCDAAMAAMVAGDAPPVKLARETERALWAFAEAEEDDRAEMRLRKMRKRRVAGAYCNEPLGDVLTLSVF